MTSSEELKANIQDRLGPGAKVTVVNVGASLRLLAVSDQFDGMSRQARRSRVFGGAVPPNLHWFELTTPAELEADPTLAEMLAPSAPLPTWTDSLTRGSIEDVVPIFRTELAPRVPLVVTFFSLRGGVGRSTALSSVAHLLSSPGGDYRKRIIAIDFDLEAPGLAPLLGVESQLGTGQGVLHLLNQLDVPEGQLAPAELDEHLIEINKNFLLLPAGIPDASYAAGLSRIVPDLWYEEDSNSTPFHRLLAEAARHPSQPDIILLDARTGLSAVTAPLLFDLSDVVVVCFYPHPQSKIGTDAVVSALVRSGISSAPRPYFVASPLPVGNAGVIQEERAIEWAWSWLEPLNVARSNAGLQQVLPEEQLALVRYSEAMAASDVVSNDGTSLDQYLRIADWLAGNSESTVEVGASDTQPLDKQALLGKLRFGSVAGEELTESDLESTFLETDDVSRALEPGVALVTGRKGTGKSTLFNKMAREPNVIIGLSPTGFTSPSPAKRWLSADQFAEIEKTLKERRISWSAFWKWHIAAVVGAQAGGALLVPADATPAEYLSAFRSEGDQHGTTGANAIESVAGNWLAVFDGLDSQFGSDGYGRERRAAAVAGLLDVVVNWQSTSVRLKVLLRHDLYRSASVINKSHLRSRQADLRWSSQHDFLSVALKQLLVSAEMRTYVSLGNNVLSALVKSETPIEEWPESAVIDAWHRFTSERMAGGDTAFTRNWVYTRLADGNSDRTPRNLHLLLRHAVQLETTFSSRGQSYSTSLVRPRALQEALPTVSAEAVDALGNDEFPELAVLLDALRVIPKTPFPAEMISEVPADLVDLGKEVGLLAIDPRGDTRPVRVPELYRYGLGIGRRGQA